MKVKSFHLEEPIMVVFGNNKGESVTYSKEEVDAFSNTDLLFKHFTEGDDVEIQLTCEEHSDVVMKTIVNGVCVLSRDI